MQRDLPGLALPSLGKERKFQGFTSNCFEAGSLIQTHSSVTVETPETANECLVLHPAGAAAEH